MERLAGQPGRGGFRSGSRIGGFWLVRVFVWQRLVRRSERRVRRRVGPAGQYRLPHGLRLGFWLVLVYRSVSGE